MANATPIVTLNNAQTAVNGSRVEAALENLKVQLASAHPGVDFRISMANVKVGSASYDTAAMATINQMRLALAISRCRNLPDIRKAAETVEVIIPGDDVRQRTGHDDREQSVDRDRHGDGLGDMPNKD